MKYFHLPVMCATLLCTVVPQAHACVSGVRIDWPDHIIGGPDKTGHAACSALLGVEAALLFNKGKSVDERSFWGPFALAMVPGVLVEISDERKRRHGHGGEGFSVRDLAADMAGVAVGVLTTNSGKVHFTVLREQGTVFFVLQTTF